MALYNLAQMTTVTSGTGSITLLAAAPGCLTFDQAGVPNGKTVSYAITDGINREVGAGVYTTSTKNLTRNVLNSTNSNNPINLSGNYAQVYITPNSTDIHMGYYGAWYDTTNQPLVNSALAQRIKFDTQDDVFGISTVITSGTGTGIQFLNQGIYNIQFSIQIINTDSKAHNVSIWARINEADYPYSNSYISVPSAHGGGNGQSIMSVNFLKLFNVNDIFELWWSSDDTTVSIATIGAGASPVTPASPSIILTAMQIKDGVF